MAFILVEKTEIIGIPKPHWLYCILETRIQRGGGRLEKNPPLDKSWPRRWKIAIMIFEQLKT